MILAGCVVGYFAVNGAMTALDYFITKCSVLSFNIGGDAVFLDLNLPAFDDQLTVSLRSNKKTVSKELSVGAYFDSDGVLHQDVVFKAFQALVKQYKNKDEAKTS